MPRRRISSELIIEAFEVLTESAPNFAARSLAIINVRRVGRTTPCPARSLRIEVYDVAKQWKARAFIDKDEYEKLYRESVEKPDKFWGKEGKRIDWIKPYTQVKNTSFAYPDVSIKWFEDGTLNVAANCIDRHLKKRGKQVAIIWEPDDPSQEARTITYRELYNEVCRLATC